MPTTHRLLIPLRLTQSLRQQQDQISGFQFSIVHRYENAHQNIMTVLTTDRACTSGSEFTFDKHVEPPKPEIRDKADTILTTATLSQRLPAECLLFQQLLKL